MLLVEALDCFVLMCVRDVSLSSSPVEACDGKFGWWRTCRGCVMLVAVLINEGCSAPQELSERAAVIILEQEEDEKGQEED